MQSTSIFFTVLLLSTTVFCIDLRHQSSTISTTTTASKDVELLQKSKTGSMLVSLAQLYLQMEGPVDDLTQAITDLLSDLETKLSDENSNWAVTTSQHETRVEELQSNIDYADSDVKTSIQKLENVLNPLKLEIEDEIATISERIAVNQDSTIRENSQREEDLVDFDAKVQEHQDGINACDEAIGLVNELMNSSPSLIQIRKAKNSVANIQKKLGKKNQYSPLIKALTQLALDQNFVDQETVQKIVDLLNNLRENLSNSLQTLNEDETVSKKNYEDRLAQLAEELSQLQTTLEQRTLDLQTTNSKKSSIIFIEKLLIFLNKSRY